MAKKAAAPKNLTSTILDRQTIKGVTWVADAGCSGLRARLSLNRGNRQVAFYYRYRDRTTGDRKIMKVGDYPAISIADARSKVNTELRPMADEQMDVKAEIRRKTLSEAAGAAQTIDKLIDPYLEYCALDGRSEGTVTSYKRYLRPLRFWWAGRLPSEMTRGDCQDIFLKVQKVGVPDADGNPSKDSRKGGHRAAGLTHAASRAFFTYLLDRELVQANPWAGQKKLALKGRSGISKRALTDDEIREGMAMGGVDGLLFRVLLATGVRPMELCGARWSEIDLATGEWVIPAERMKYKGSAHTVYLSSYALALLKAWGRGQKGRPRYVFPTGGRLGHLHSDQMRWAGMSPKHCRATCRTNLQKLGCPEEVRSRISHHQRQDRVQKAYDKHGFDAEAKLWWQTWGDALAKLEPDHEPTDNVVYMNKA